MCDAYPVLVIRKTCCLYVWNDFFIYVRHDLFECPTYPWLSCRKNCCLCVYHESLCVIWHIHVRHNSSMCDITQRLSYISLAFPPPLLCTYVTWLIDIRVTCLILVWHTAFSFVLLNKLIIHDWHPSFIYVWHDSFLCHFTGCLSHISLPFVSLSLICICVTWLLHVCDMNCPYVWYDPSIYVWHDAFM